MFIYSPSPPHVPPLSPQYNPDLKLFGGETTSVNAAIVIQNWGKDLWLSRDLLQYLPQFFFTVNMKGVLSLIIPVKP